MILFIDTTDHDQARIALVARETVWHKFDSRNLSEQLLTEIKKFCKKQKVELNELAKIAVVIGHGGFSRIRTAVATANALALGLKIPVIGLNKSKIPNNLADLINFKNQKMVAPIYSSAPNITMSKKHEVY